MVSEMIFTFNVDSGTDDAHMTNWPGAAPISTGKLGRSRAAKITITLNWSSILTNGKEEVGRELPVKAKRVGE
jgi:hypothetical protein